MTIWYPFFGDNVRYCPWGILRIRSHAAVYAWYTEKYISFEMAFLKPTIYMQIASIYLLIKWQIDPF
jgi:hypothetical protein